MSRQEEFTPDQIAEALKACEGFQATAADMLGCCEETIIAYRRRYPELEQLIRHLREKHKDYAEGSLLKHIKDGKEASLIFYLKTQCRNRGYTERVDVSGEIKIESILGALPAELAAEVGKLLTKQISEGSGIKSSE